MYTPQSFIHSSAYGHFDRLHVLPTVNSAALAMGGQNSLPHADFNSFGYRQSSGTVGLYGSSIFNVLRTSLVAQWLRTCLPVQGTRVQALVQEDPTCCRETKAVHHNY